MQAVWLVEFDWERGYICLGCCAIPFRLVGSCCLQEADSELLLEDTRGPEGLIAA